MKFLRMPVAAIAALSLSVAVQAQTADEIINKHLEAIGGKEKIASLKSLVVESEMDIMGTPAPTVTTTLYKKGYISEVNYNGQKIINCVTSDKGGWTVNPLAGVVTAEPMPADQVKSGQVQLEPGGSLYNYAANGFTAELAGQEEVNGKKAYKIVLTGKDGTSFTHFVDPTSYFIVRTVAKMTIGGNPIEQSVNFSDYKKTDFGMLVPNSFSIELPNGMVLTSTVKKVEVNKEIDPKIFDKP